MEKRTYPFRLGCTSYVYPMDIVPNVERMAPVVDDIELVFFESLDFSNIPDPAVIQRLADLAQQNDITYTVHFPINLRGAVSDSIEREKFVDQVKKNVDLTSPLGPYGYLLHLEYEKEIPYRQIEEGWKKHAYETCDAIARIPGLEQKRICLENLTYPYNWNLPLAEEFGFSLCVDVGHLLMNGCDVGKACCDMLLQTRVIHFHGLQNGKDHHAITNFSDEWLADFFSNSIAHYQHVLTLEVFNEADIFSSIEAVEKIWAKLS